MAGALWVVGEVVDGHLARIGSELGTLGRALAADADRGRRDRRRRRARGRGRKGLPAALPTRSRSARRRPASAPLPG